MSHLCLPAARHWAGFLLVLLLLTLATPGVSQVLQFEAADGVVRAREGERIVWENVHDRQHFFELTGPLTLGDSVYYAVGLSLYEVDAASGEVRRRHTLPGACHSLTADSGELIVEVGSHELPSSWTRTYRASPEKLAMPFFLGGWLLAARLPRSDAEGVFDSIRRADPVPHRDSHTEAWRRTAEARPFVEQAVRELEELARRDRTNPFYRYQLGVLLQDLGREAEALEAFEAVLELPSEYDSELLPLVLPLDRISPEFGDEAFRRAMRFLMKHGYEPEMNQFLIVLLLHYGDVGAALDPVRDLDRINHLAARIWDLAPYVEGSASFYRAVAEANADAGNAEAARLWQSRMREALPHRFGFPSSYPGKHGPASNAGLAALLALILAFLVKAVRYGPTQWRSTGWWRWNSFAFWSRAELVGFLLVIALGVGAWWMFSLGVVAVARGTALPLQALTGNYGHPAGVAYLKGFRGTAGGDFVYALSLQKAGALEEAAAIYARLPGARARNNLGVIRHAQGRGEEARRLFAEARAASPELSEAAYNLAEEVHSWRVERARKYDVAGPLYAMPSLAMWDEALTAPLSLSVFLRGAPLEDLWVLIPGFLLTALVAGLSLFCRAPTSPTSTAVSRIGWGLGLLVPGTARQLGFVGPPLLMLFWFSVLVSSHLAGSEGMFTNFYDAVATPALIRPYGLATLAQPPFQTAVRATAELWWILWTGNPLVVLLLDRFRPDLCGPRGPAASEKRSQRF